VPLHTDHPEARWVAWWCEAQAGRDGASVLADGQVVLSSMGEQAEALKEVEQHVPPQLPRQVLETAPMWNGERIYFAPWYPVFWSNVLQWSDPFNPRGDDLPLTPDRPAQLIAHPQADALDVVHPSGARSDFPVTAPAMLDAREIGTYVVRQYREGEVLAQTRLVVEPPEGEVGAGSAQSMTGAAAPSAGATAGVPESFELWPILAALALVILIAEWWWFHRVRGLR